MHQDVKKKKRKSKGLYSFSLPFFIKIISASVISIYITCCALFDIGVIVFFLIEILHLYLPNPCF